jgi:hypothetical protein
MPTLFYMYVQLCKDGYCRRPEKNKGVWMIGFAYVHRDGGILDFSFLPERLQVVEVLC